MLKSRKLIAPNVVTKQSLNKHDLSCISPITLAYYYGLLGLDASEGGFQLDPISGNGVRILFHEWYLDGCVDGMVQTTLGLVETLCCLHQILFWTNIVRSQSNYPIKSWPKMGSIIPLRVYSHFFLSLNYCVDDFSIQTNLAVYYFGYNCVSYFYSVYMS